MQMNELCVLLKAIGYASERCKFDHINKFINEANDQAVIGDR